VGGWQVGRWKGGVGGRERSSGYPSPSLKFMNNHVVYELLVLFQEFLVEANSTR
jgi:hypothetical protein